MRHLNYEEIQLKEGFIVAEKTASLTEHSMHAHDALEISIVLSHRIRYKLLEQDYYGSEGDIFLHRPFEPHWTLIDRDAPPASWVMILFPPSMIHTWPFSEHILAPFYAVHQSPLIPACANTAPLIQRAAQDALREQKEQRPGWESRRALCLMDVLLLIYRHYSESKSPEADDPSTSDMIRVIHDMMMRLGDKLVVEDYIRKTSLGKTRFYQVFKHITGLSPSRFITRMRLQSAVYQLSYSEASITEVALNCGFESASYFNRCFQQYMGCSPREYRKRLNPS